MFIANAWARRVLAAALALAALLAAGASFGADPFAWKVRMLGAASVTGDRVMLGEIAEPVGDMDEGTWKILASTPLWPFPGREGQMTIPRSKVLEDLEKIFPRSEGNFIVPEQITMRKGGGKPVVAADLRKLAVEFLTQKMADVEGELEVKDITMVQQMFLNDDTERLSIEPGGPVGPGRVHMRVVISNLEGKSLRQASANAFVNLWRMIPVAGRNIYPKDGAITENMMIFEKRNLAFVKGQPWDPKAGMVRVKASITPGTALTSETVEPLPLVCKGDQITLVWRGAHIQLTMPVVAVTEGSKDTVITVRNLQSGKELAAVVRDSKTVTAK